MPECRLLCLDDAELLIEMADEDEEALRSPSNLLKAGKELGAMEFQLMPGGPHDRSNCFVSKCWSRRNESQDWVGILEDASTLLRTKRMASGSHG